MEKLAEVTTWISIPLGIALILVGVHTLWRQQPGLRWMRDRVRWQPWGISCVLFGTYALLQSLPRVLHASPGVVFAFTLVGAGLLIAAAVLNLRAQIRRR